MTSQNKGQVMIITVLALSGTIIGATTIAGLLMLYQIKQASDVVGSTKAIFAADTGLEWRLYRFYKVDYQKCNFPDGKYYCDDGLDRDNTQCPQPESLSSDLSFITTCEPKSGPPKTVTIKATGRSGAHVRSFEINLVQQ